MREERTCARAALPWGFTNYTIDDRDTYLTDTLQTQSFRLDSAQLLYDLVTDHARQAFTSSGAPPGAAHAPHRAARTSLHIPMARLPYYQLITEPHSLYYGTCILPASGAYK
jgi:hypothetical protein